MSNISFGVLSFNCLFYVIKMFQDVIISEKNGIKGSVLFKSNPPFFIAHRGASSLAPENTLLSFQRAFFLGARYWELDVQLTRDAQVVVFHDQTLERTTNVKQVYPERIHCELAQFSYVELQCLDCSSWFFQQDAKKTTQGCLTPQTIPLLRDVLLLAKSYGVGVNVEIKDLSSIWDDDFVVKKVLDVIFDLEMETDVLISSFYLKYLKIVKTLAPQIATAVLWSGQHPNPLDLTLELGAMAYHTNVLPDFRTLQRFSNKGLYCLVFTINSLTRTREIFTKGGSGIFTDVIQETKNWTVQLFQKHEPQKNFLPDQNYDYLALRRTKKRKIIRT
ncbi:MAG: glycerophosphodiester phosphodiesterase family protein [Desulfonauticus sp.]|nr:glycerophosphodiester phosphodiesterase family protein [Desulfonauticus sp.]